ncbi:chord-domain-containing protein [Tilletiaria anomala UBC 951]|uniref:Chord-domain-containing protein n=1 Tax=Tilletiaria anomala (strain ATCC 24038 / CBS 436.72 / UBC 951) TaxID=1037660 RepID=A0A066WPY8_TILAU|nr:chord-domain-containing protein [Tilletiaria anomala UBC 951]KDN53069.1 chord-domain-containing protein [Tilletiaria anomala UBC 951]
MVICARRGCGADFDAATPSSSACHFHPGAPVFHEGLKSWSCCQDVNKPVMEFDQFLAIKGCAEAPSHTVEMQELPDGAAAKKSETEGPSAVTANGVETYGRAAPQPVTQPLVGNSLAAAQKAMDAGNAAPVEKAEEADPSQADEEGAVKDGTKCKRAGCSYTFTGGKRSRSEEKCSYHKGVAIFHEGSKGWSCCKPRVLDFADFLAIAPCTEATNGHLFVGDQSKASAASTDGYERVDCRVDHYETPDDVRVTVYAKAVQTEKSKVEFREDAVLLSLEMPPAPGGSDLPRRHERVLKPFANIDADSSTFTFTKFKVDLVLVKKVKGQSWPSLESGDKAIGYGLTFGRSKDVRA